MRRISECLVVKEYQLVTDIFSVCVINNLLDGTIYVCQLYMYDNNPVFYFVKAKNFLQRFSLYTVLSIQNVYAYVTYRVSTQRGR